MFTSFCEECLILLLLEEGSPCWPGHSNQSGCASTSGEQSDSVTTLGDVWPKCASPTARDVSPYTWEPSCYQPASNEQWHCSFIRPPASSMQWVICWKCCSHIEIFCVYWFLCFCLSFYQVLLQQRLISWVPQFQGISSCFLFLMWFMSVLIVHWYWTQQFEFTLLVQDNVKSSCGVFDSSYV